MREIGKKLTDQIVDVNQGSPVKSVNKDWHVFGPALSNDFVMNE